CIVVRSLLRRFLPYILSFLCFLLFFFFFFFFFNDTSPTDIYTLSLHDALPILHAFDEQVGCKQQVFIRARRPENGAVVSDSRDEDRKSTRLNSSHRTISYAVFCLKKKKKKKTKKTMKKHKNEQKKSTKKKQ